MKIQDSIVLSRLPEYLVDSKNDEVLDNEPLESLNPNSINVTASLIEKLMYGLEAFNNWTDFNEYSKEFKLDEVLDGIKDSFSISQAELLKGFFKSKGTLADIQFVLKTAGYNLNIYEAEYYYQNQSITGVMSYRYYEIFKDLLAAGYTEEQFLALLTTTRIMKVNNVVIKKVDNNNPIKVINVNISAEEFFRGLDWIPSQAQLDALPEVLSLYLEASLLDSSVIDCSITADISADMDTVGFDGINVSKISALLESIIKTRLSICTYLRRFMIFLEMRDKYNVKQRIDDVSYINFIISKSVLSDFPFIDRVKDAKSRIELTRNTVDIYDRDMEDPITLGIIKNTLKSYPHLKIGDKILDPTRDILYSGYVGSNLRLEATFTD